MPLILVLAGAAGVASYGIAGWVRGYAVRRAMLDIPNARSSHTAPTPRGGGLAIVFCVLAIATAGSLAGLVELRLAVALAGGGGLVALAGWLDDRRGLGAGPRLACHIAAATWAAAWLGGLPVLALPSGALTLGLPGGLLAVVGIVWATNLFNFMDGIDGLAAGEAVTLGSAGVLLLIAGGASGAILLPAAVTTASLGFLSWNWAPARLFMGDVGSGFLGFAFAVLAIWSERTGDASLLLWGVAAMAFVFDATVTLARRLGRREGLVAAHRHHAYQRLTRSGLGHAQVVGLYTLLNLALLGLALAGRVGWVHPFLAVGLAIAVCAFAYLAVERRQPM